MGGRGPRLTKKEALTRHKLAEHKPNMNAYVVYASEGQLPPMLCSSELPCRHFVLQRSRDCFSSPLIRCGAAPLLLRPSARLRFLLASHVLAVSEGL